MASPAKDIRGSLILTPVQASFMGNVIELMKSRCKYDAGSALMLKRGPARVYSDFVVTVKCSQDRRTCEVYRNRTGMLVFAMLDGKVIAADYEIDFVAEHVKHLLDGAHKEGN